jgi:hypothetical protein
LATMLAVDPPGLELDSAADARARRVAHTARGVDGGRVLGSPATGGRDVALTAPGREAGAHARAGRILRGWLVGAAALATVHGFTRIHEIPSPRGGDGFPARGH